jgi:hypothetical protein
LSTDGQQSTGRRWPEGSGSIVALLALAAGWLIVAGLSPATMEQLHIGPMPQPLEGKFEWAQETLLTLCVVAWAVIAWNVRRQRAALAVAVAMTLQVALVLGEELDWGAELGLPGWQRHRNFRVFFRDYGITQKWDDTLPTTFVWLAFYAAAIFPWARARRKAAATTAPVAAVPLEALALALVFPAWGALWLALGGKQSGEFLQMGTYFVVAMTTARILRAVLR